MSQELEPSGQAISMRKGAAEVCYICAEPIAAAERDTDHVPPKALFNKEDRTNLFTLPTHRACNGAFAKDDEYFRLCMTAAALPHNPKARQLWGDPIPATGPAMRGFHRPESRGLKRAVLKNLVPVDVKTPAGLYLGSGEVMLQEADRIKAVVNRIIRGLYTRRTSKVLPVNWPVSCEMMPPDSLAGYNGIFKFEFFNAGNGTFLFASKHLSDDDREAVYWLVFYETVQFCGFSGTQIRSRLPW